MLAGKDKYLPEMDRCGIPRSAVPVELGGEHPSSLLLDFIRQTVADYAAGVDPLTAMNSVLPPAAPDEHEHEQQRDQPHPATATAEQAEGAAAGDAAS